MGKGFTSEDLRNRLEKNPGLSIDSMSPARPGGKVWDALEKLKPGQDAEMFPETVKAIPVKQKKTKEPNKTEREFGAYLRHENPECDVLFEAYTLKLGDDCRYTPDWALVSKFDGSINFYEVKGAFLFKGATKSATDSSLTKPKTAASMFRHTFHIARKAKDGSWSIERINGKVDEPLESAQDMRAT